MKRALARRFFTAIVVLVCVAIIVGFRLVGSDAKRSNVWNPDEAISACAANSINQGGLPYRDAVDHRGPLTYYIYSVIFKAAGRNNMVAVHVVLAAIVAVLALMVYALGRFCWGDDAGLVAMAVFTLLTCVGAEDFDLLAFHTEWPLLVCTTAAMLLVVRSSRAGRPGPLFTAGLLFGCGFLSKQVAVADFGAAVVFVLIAGAAIGAPWRRTAASTSLLAAGAVIPIVGTVGWFAARGALADFWFYFWTYNTEYYMRPITAAMQIRVLPDMWIYFVEHGLLPIVALALVGVVSAGAKLLTSLRSAERRLPDEIILFSGWLVASWLGASVSTRGFGHYYIAVLAPMSLTAAYSFERLLALIRSPSRNRALEDAESDSKRPVNLRRVSAVCVACLAAAYTTDLISKVFSTAGGGWGNPYLAVSRHIASHSSTDDTIFVWGFVPEIYVQSDRMHASRYTFCNQVTGLIPWENIDEPNTSATAVPGAMGIMMEELTRNRPIFIVDTSIGNVWAYGKYPFPRFPQLDAFVRDSYREVGVQTNADGTRRLRLLQRAD